MLLHRRRPADELAQLAVPALRLTRWIYDMLPEDVELRFREQAPHYLGFVLATPPDPLPNPAETTRLTEQARTYSLWLGAGFAPLIVLYLSARYGLACVGLYLLSGAVTTLLALALSRSEIRQV